LRHPQSRHLENQAKSQHCNDRNTLSSSLFTFFLIQGGIIFTMASRRVTVDSAKKNKFVNIFLLMPETGVTDAMRSAMFTEEDIPDLRMRRFLQHALPGGLIKGLKAYIAGLLPLPVDPAATAAPPEEVAYRHKRKPPPHLPIDPAATAPPLKEVVIDSGETVLSSLSPGTAATVRKEKRKQWNHTFYKNKKKKMVGLFTSPVSMDPWAVSSSRKVRTPAAKKMAKQWRVKPSIDQIINAGNVQSQAAILRALADHPALASAVEMAGIATSRVIAAAKFVCTQSARMMERARSAKQLCGNKQQQKRDAAEVMLTFTAPSPVRKAGNPSRRDHARALGVPQSTLSRVEKHMIEKRRLLSAGEMGIHWALAKKKKRYSKISDELKLLLVNAFHDHPHVVVSPNTKDTLR
jgi:hypothetical protein